MVANPAWPLEGGAPESRSGAVLSSSRQEPDWSTLTWAFGSGLWLHAVERNAIVGSHAAGMTRTRSPGGLLSPISLGLVLWL
jgi:hypothetical protein